MTEHVACTVCGCVCDDLRVTVDAGRITQAEGACPLARPWFLAQGSRCPPTARSDGQAVALDHAIRQAALLLHDAHAPLIFGLSRSSTDGQRAAVALAERVGASIAVAGPANQAPSFLAVQEVGEVTCTLGEVRNRADLVIYWGANPVQTQPRHLERYAVYPTGRYLPGGRAARTVVVVDEQPTETSALADLFIPITAGQDFEALTLLRGLVRGAPLATDPDVGASLALLQGLAERMKTCRYGVVFHGPGLTRHGTGEHAIAALLLLVRELNQHARFCARRLSTPNEPTGANAVLTWQTGYPYAVNFARGYPRFNAGEFAGATLLERGDVDACVLVGSETGAGLSERAQAHLRRIPTIALDDATAELAFAARIQFTTAVDGIHRPGIAYRMDGVPIPLSAFLPSAYPSEAEVLGAILEQVGRQ